MHGLKLDPGEPYLLGRLARELQAAGDHASVVRLLQPALATRPMGKFQADAHDECSGILAVARTFLRPPDAPPGRLVVPTRKIILPGEATPR
jgi:hypothetical protein